MREFRDASLEEKFDYRGAANAFAEKCNKEPSGWRNCYGKEVRKLYKETKNLNIALKTIKTLQDVDIKARDCHILAHELTRELVESDPANWDIYLDMIEPSECNYGYIHGILEARKRFDSSFVLNSTSITDFCEMLTQKKQARGTDQTCAHIMGHLVLVETFQNIPEGKKICAEIPKKLQKECFSGLFMENFTRDNLVVHGIANYVPWDERVISAQEKLCSEQKGEAARGCWQETSNFYLQQYPYDTEKIFFLCGRSRADEYRDLCYFDSMPSLLAVPNPKKEDYARICRTYEGTERFRDCIFMGVGALLGATDKNIDRVSMFCSSFEDNETIGYCYRVSGSTVRGKYGYDRQVAVCEKVPSEYKDQCNSTGSITINAS